MSELLAAIDEASANDLFDTVVAGLGTQTTAGQGSLGPFTATYAASATLTNGNVDLIPPDTIQIKDLVVQWALNLQIGLDLSDFLPDIHIPQICVTIPCVGKVCTPSIDIDWPTVSVPINLSDAATATVDLGLLATLVGNEWVIEAVVQGIPFLQFGLNTAAYLAAIGAAVALAVGWVPLIGPFLAILVAAVVAAIGVAGLTGFLGPILSLFLAGKRFEIDKVADLFEVLPFNGPLEPAVHVRVDSLAAEIQHNAPEDELVVLADISPA